MKIRIGNGYDVHRLVSGRSLILGGVEIDWPLGLEGHSDADVLLHSLCDAILGAAGLGDIGQHFPPGHPDYLDIDSRVLLRKVREMVADCGYSVGNVDCTIVAERPKLAPYSETMRRNIADDLGVQEGVINIKATTTEGLGFAGREEGIAAWSSVLLQST